jgi:uncharacterized protein (TIGR03083 family)
VPHTTPPPLADWLATHASSHQRLAAIVGQLSPAEVAGPSYDTEWSVAQVLSHLGSGAEIFTLFLQAGLGALPVPGMPEFEPIWERWNAKPPQDQAADALVAEQSFLDQLGALDDRELRSWRLDMFGSTQRLSDVLQMRVSEHALHTWDVAVTRDPAATVAPDAVELLIDTLGPLVARTGRPPAQALRVPIATIAPARRFVVVADGEAVALHANDRVRGAETEGEQMVLQLPAEAFIRLAYGRLDAAHTPSFTGDDGDLDVLRRTFPGF